MEKLQYKWNEVHELAEQLEHIDSSNMIDRLENFLGNPIFDPHGDPIPDKNGKIKLNSSMPLSGGQKGKTYVVVRLAETSDAFLSHLEKMNIKPGTRVKLVDQNGYDQSFSVQAHKKSFQLSEKVAGNILVQPA